MRFVCTPIDGMTRSTGTATAAARDCCTATIGPVGAGSAVTGYDPGATG